MEIGRKRSRESGEREGEKVERDAEIGEKEKGERGEK